MKTYHSDNAPKAIGPYSQMIQAGNFYYLSGQTPIDPATGKLVEGDVTEQAKQVFANIKAVLEAAELTPENVVKSTVFLSSMDLFQDMNKVYAEFYGDHKPARSAFAVKGLPMGCDVEIETIAYKEA
ncbi:MAG TPA: RidA family protein [Tissierellia bacterium]|nr:RidA family protein [Tissierellia bacterium]